MSYFWHFQIYFNFFHVGNLVMIKATIKWFLGIKFKRYLTNDTQNTSFVTYTKVTMRGLKYTKE